MDKFKLTCTAQSFACTPGALKNAVHTGSSGTAPLTKNKNAIFDFEGGSAAPYASCVIDSALLLPLFCGTNSLEWPRFWSSLTMARRFHAVGTFVNQSLVLPPPPWPSVDQIKLKLDRRYITCKWTIVVLNKKKRGQFLCFALACLYKLQVQLEVCACIGCCQHTITSRN